jgi:hypothetical protein
LILKKQAKPSLDYNILLATDDETLARDYSKTSHQKFGRGNRGMSAYTQSGVRPIDDE